MNLTQCPAKDALADYAVGNLVGDEMSALETHVECCTHCQTVIDALDGRADSLLKRLYQVPLPSPYAGEPPLQQALVHARQLAPATDTSVSAEADTNSPEKIDPYHTTSREPNNVECQPDDSSAWPPGKRPKSVAEFEQCLIAGGLFTKTEIEDFKQKLPANDQPKTIKELALALARADRLTRYQALVAFEGLQHPLVYGPYVILDEIGMGGMGKVFKARHQRMDRLVALKVLAAGALSSPKALERFHQEVRAAAQLSHPNIVAAYDAGEQNGAQYFVMEYVEGRDLSDVVKDKGPLPIAQAVDYIIQTARGLEYAHCKGIIHRDIKPANLVLGKADFGMRNDQSAIRNQKSAIVKILDMGLARMDALGDPNNEARQLTESGQLMGTVDYMSPEQAEDTRSADHRADIYSLGCTLYRLLTGKSPYAGQNVMQVLIAHRSSPIPSLETDCPGTPAELNATFQKMLAKNRDDRQPSMTEVICELEAVLNSSDTRSVTPPPVLIDVRNQNERPSTHTGLTAFMDKIANDAPTLAKTPRAKEKSAISPPWILGGVIVGGLALLILLGVVVIKLSTPMGEIEVVLDDGVADSIEIAVSKGGKEVDLINKAAGWKLSVSDGEYIINIKGGEHRFKVQDKKVSIYQGNVAKVRVTLTPAIAQDVDGNGAMGSVILSARQPDMCLGKHGTAAMLKRFDNSHALRVRNVSSDIVSFESISKPSFFLVRDEDGILLFKTGNAGKASQFRIIRGFGSKDPRLVSFESVIAPGNYLRIKDQVVNLERLEDSNTFKRDSTFVIKELSPNKVTSDTSDSTIEKVFLGSLTPFHTGVGFGSYGVNYAPGGEGVDKITGETNRQYIFMHAHAECIYPLPAQSERLEMTVALGHPDGGVGVTIFADEKEIVKRLTVNKKPVPISVAIPANSNLLRIAIDTDGIGIADHSYLVEPILTVRHSRLNVPYVVAVWSLYAGGQRWPEKTLYSTGRAMSQYSSDTWTVDGNTLTYRWYSNDAPGGAWIDTCTLLPDGRSFEGWNQRGIHVHGQLQSIGETKDNVRVNRDALAEDVKSIYANIAGTWMREDGSTWTIGNHGNIDVSDTNGKENKDSSGQVVLKREGICIVGDNARCRNLRLTNGNALVHSRDGDQLVLNRKQRGSVDDNLEIRLERTVESFHLAVIGDWIRDNGARWTFSFDGKVTARTPDRRADNGWSGSFAISAKGLCILRDDGSYKFLEFTDSNTLTRQSDDDEFVLTRASADEFANRWRYTLAPTGDDWMATNFDDTKWSQGEMPFTGPEKLTRGSWWNTKSIWLRRTVELDAEQIQRIAFWGRHDEDVEIYANGDLIASDSGYYDMFLRPTDEDRQSLKPGVNTIAVHCIDRGFARTINVNFATTFEELPIEWAYTFEHPGPNWQLKQFDSSLWKRGNAPFRGFELLPGMTMWPTNNIWLRRTFRLKEKELENIALLIHHDDDAQVYINDKLTVDVEGHGIRVLPITQEALETINAGENTIAVHCMDRGQGRHIEVELVHTLSLPNLKP